MGQESEQIVRFCALRPREPGCDTPAYVPPAPYTSPLAEALAGDLLERFLRYVRIDTQSKRDRTASPSTPGQLELGRLLVGELRSAGLTDAALDDNGYVTATLPASRSGPGRGSGRGSWPGRGGRPGRGLAGPG